jgi:hypothetical protein
MAKVATIDDGDIRSAVSLHWPDFEDAVQFTAVESAKADYIITRNTKDCKLAPPEKIITPDDFVAIFIEPDKYRKMKAEYDKQHPKKKRGSFPD